MLQMIQLYCILHLNMKKTFLSVWMIQCIIFQKKKNTLFHLMHRTSQFTHLLKSRHVNQTENSICIYIYLLHYFNSL